MPTALVPVLEYVLHERIRNIDNYKYILHVEMEKRQA